MFDYKTDYLEREHNRQFNSIEAWIYVGIDTLKAGRFKIGLTTNGLNTRHTSSQNPDYTLLVGFKIKVDTTDSEIKEIEKAVLTEVAKAYPPIYHYYSGNKSEWFEGDPNEVRDFVNDFLYENYSYKMLCGYCDIRNKGIIYGWENRYVLYGEERNSYQVNDISDPIDNPDCSNYGGCGSTNCETCSDNWFLKDDR
jgi:hypothetical protein